MTAMGVFWGIFMLIIMAGSGLGLERMFLGQLTFAKNSAFMFTNKTSEAYKGFKEGRNFYFKLEDVEFIKKNIPEVDIAVGLNWGGQYNISRGNQNSPSTQVMGFMPDYYKIDPVSILNGRYINDLDIAQKRKVCLLGLQIYKQLFPTKENPIGKEITIGQSKFIVAGVVTAQSNASLIVNTDRTVIIPMNVMQQMYNQGEDINIIAVTSKEGYAMIEIEQKLKQILSIRHTISPTDTKAIQSFNTEEQVKIFDNLFLGIRLLTWIVGLGTLFAGVIGVSNIMLIVIKERTQEIGVRRALGAKPMAIIGQIVSESFVLTFIAGVAGLGVSVGLLSLIEKILAAQTSVGETSFNPQITFSIAISAAAVIIISGFFSGIIPAVRAIKIKAVDAIREE